MKQVMIVEVSSFHYEIKYENIPESALEDEDLLETSITAFYTPSDGSNDVKVDFKIDGPIGEDGTLLNTLEGEAIEEIHANQASSVKFNFKLVIEDETISVEGPGFHVFPYFDLHEEVISLRLNDYKGIGSSCDEVEFNKALNGFVDGQPDKLNLLADYTSCENRVFQYIAGKIHYPPIVIAACANQKERVNELLKLAYPEISNCGVHASRVGSVYSLDLGSEKFPLGYKSITVETEPVPDLSFTSAYINFEEEELYLDYEIKYPGLSGGETRRKIRQLEETAVVLMNVYLFDENYDQGSSDSTSNHDVLYEIKGVCSGFNNIEEFKTAKCSLRNLNVRMNENDCVAASVSVDVTIEGKIFSYEMDHPQNR